MDESPLAALSGLSQAGVDALMTRWEGDELTAADQELLAVVWPQVEEAMQAVNEMLASILLPGFGGAWAECFSALGTGKASYRTEPIPGAELGGQPRNPEADVIDEIDQLVTWQLEKGGGW